jgi:hypothetical protein
MKALGSISQCIAMHRGGRDYNSIAAHLDQSNYLANQQQQVLGLAVSFSSLSILYKKNGL